MKSEKCPRAINKVNFCTSGNFGSFHFINHKPNWNLHISYIIWVHNRSTKLNMSHNIILFRGMLSLRFYIIQNDNGDGFFEPSKACQAFFCYLLDCQWKVNASVYLWALEIKAFIVYWVYAGQHVMHSILILPIMSWLLSIVYIWYVIFIDILSDKNDVTLYKKMWLIIQRYYLLFWGILYIKELKLKTFFITRHNGML